MKRQQGFTLIELMVVVTVIAVLLSMAIPMVIRARIAANEGSAASSMRTIVSSNETYKTRFRTYATNLIDLSNAQILDDVLGNADTPPGKSGYLVTYSGGTHTYTVNADPVDVGGSGIRSFFVDHTGVIRYSEGTPATSTSTPID